MRIVTSEIAPLASNRIEDPAALAVEDNLSALLNCVLCYLPQIGSVTEFVAEYGEFLGMGANFIQQAYANLLEITDPNVLCSSAYKTILADLTTKTSPSLIDAANNSDETVLASVLLQMKGIDVQPLTVSQFTIDINLFIHFINY